MVQTTPFRCYDAWTEIFLYVRVEKKSSDGSKAEKTSEAEKTQTKALNVWKANIQPNIYLSQDICDSFKSTKITLEREEENRCTDLYWCLRLMLTLSFRCGRWHSATEVYTHTNTYIFFLWWSFSAYFTDFHLIRRVHLLACLFGDVGVRPFIPIALCVYIGRQQSDSIST